MLRYHTPRATIPHPSLTGDQPEEGTSITMQVNPALRCQTWSHWRGCQHQQQLHAGLSAVALQPPVQLLLVPLAVAWRPRSGLQTMAGSSQLYTMIGAQPVAPFCIFFGHSVFEAP